MRRDLTVVTADGRQHDARVKAHADTPLADIVRAIGVCVGIHDTNACGPDGPLVADTAWGTSELHSGSVVSFGVPTSRPSVEGVLVRLAVTTGPDAGRLIPLRQGQFVIGRDDTADIVLSDADVSRRHVELIVSDNAITARDLGSTNGSSLTNGRHTRAIDSKGAGITAGESLKVGNTTLKLLGLFDPPASWRQSPDGDRQVNRPPRLAAVEGDTAIEFPAKPDAPDKPRVSLLPALAPVLVGLILCVLIGNLQFLLFTALGPVTLAATWISDRRAWRRAGQVASEKFQHQERAARQAFDTAAHAEVARRHVTHPDPATIRLIATGPTFRLWERARGQHHFLTARVGVANQPLTLAATRGGVTEPPMMEPGLPVVVSFCDGPVGVAGPLPWARRVAAAVTAHLVTLQSPADLRVLAFIDDTSSASWRWLRWLPSAVVATNDEEHSHLVGELNAVVAESRRNRYRDQAAAPTGSWCVVIVDAADSATVPDVTRLLDEAIASGVSAMVIARDPLALPRACRSTISPADDRATTAVVRTPDGATLTDVTVDQLDHNFAEHVARSLSGLRDAAQSDLLLPSESTLRQVCAQRSWTPAELGVAWRTPAGLSAPIGMTADGPYVLDLVADGPHALVAGTTGAGKSELLRTIVGSLGAHYPPDAVSFVLIDYKGGAAFAECSTLPHTLGMVTDLDPHLTRRVLVGLDAELKRRERIFAEVGATDWESFTAQRTHTEQTLSRLVIVVDEFATLAEELPSFVTGLVGVAQRGRSLGVHLILATQRPAGVVSADIRANVSLRICLRVADPADSTDVIGVPDAAALSRTLPGRAIVQTGNTRLTMQTALVTGPATDADCGQSTRVSVLDAWNREPGPLDKPSGPTELQLIRDAARAVAPSCLREPVQAPWLPPLPHHLAAADLPATTHGVPIGLIDEPEGQRQYPLTVDVDQGSTIGFIGGPKSGRTSALLTTAAAATSARRPDELHVHAIDCAGGRLAELTSLPHFGTFTSPEEPSRIGRLVALLVEASARGRSSRCGNARADIPISTGATPGSTAPLPDRGTADSPALMLLIDGWESFCALSDELDGGRTTDAVLQLMREGPSSGVTVAVAGDRSLLGFRFASVIGCKVVLPLIDPGDYGLAGIAATAVPSECPPGRGVLADSGLEVQMAHPTHTVPADASPARGHGNRTRPAPHEPLRLRSLPNRVDFASLPRPARRSREANGRGFWLGLGADTAEPIFVALGDGTSSQFLVAGPSRSGRTTTLIAIAHQLAADRRADNDGANHGICIAATERSRLAAWAGAHGIPVISTRTSSLDASDLLEVTRTLLVDDAERFTDTAAGDVMTDWLRRMSADHTAVIAGRSDDLHVSFRGLASEARRGETGLLLRPGPGDGDLLGIRPLPNPLGGRSGGAVGTSALPPGRGVLVTDHTRDQWPTGCPVQVAMPPDEGATSSSDEPRFDAHPTIGRHAANMRSDLWVSASCP